MKKKGIIISLCVLSILVLTIVVKLTNHGASDEEIQREEMNIADSNINLDEASLRILQIQQNLQSKDNFQLELDYEIKDKPSMHAIITVDKDITHIQAENLNVYIDSNSNTTYTNRDGHWLKSTGVYANELTDIGSEALQNIQAIGNIEVNNSVIKANSELGNATIEIDEETLLPLEINIRQSEQFKNYKYKYDLDEQLTLPNEVVNSAESFDTELSEN